MMTDYKEFKKDEINNLFEGKPYNVVYINYEKKDGIEVVSNKVNAIDKLKENNVDNFYKLYLFNDDKMITVYKFDENDFKYTEVKKEEFEDAIDREYYLDGKVLSNENLKRLKVRVGYKTGNKLKNEEEIKEEVQLVQYIGFVGGGE